MDYAVVDVAFVIVPGNVGLTLAEPDLLIYHRSLPVAIIMATGNEVARNVVLTLPEANLINDRRTPTRRNRITWSISILRIG